MTTPQVPTFQAGFRLIDGSDLNKLGDVVRSLQEGASGNAIITALTTVGAGTLTAAALVGGIVTRSGPTAAFTDTTATGAALDAALVGESIGSSFMVQIANSTAFVETIAGGTGVTVSGVTLNQPNSVWTGLLTKTGVATYTLVGISALRASWWTTFGLVATVDNGTTQTLTAAMVAGGQQTFHTSSGGSTPTLTLPAGSAMDTALPAMQVGQSYILRVLNGNSGIATMASGATGFTLSGTATIANGTWREFLVTKTAVATYTAVNIGGGSIV